MEPYLLAALGCAIAFVAGAVVGNRITIVRLVDGFSDTTACLQHLSDAASAQGRNISVLDERLNAIEGRNG